MNPVSDLFGSGDDAPIVVEEDSLSLKLWQNFIPLAERVELLRALMSETPWRETELQMYGKRVKMPRLTCWYGDPGAVYTYSGVRNDPLPWTGLLDALRNRVQIATGESFNSVLLNLYRSGSDHMSWHSDDERELGDAPVIGSLSLGASRRFNFRRASANERTTHPTRSVELTDGSLLLMTGETQRRWQHAVPKSPRVREPRVNLTFRLVHSLQRRRASC